MDGITVVRKVCVYREPDSDLYIPHLQIHEPSCDWPRCRCSYENLPLVQYASRVFETAARDARILADRIGVPLG